MLRFGTLQLSWSHIQLPVSAIASPTPPAAATTRCPLRGVGGNPLRTTLHPRTRGFSAEDNAPAAGREPPSPSPCKPAFDGTAARPSPACPRPARSAAPGPGDLRIGGSWGSGGQAGGGRPRTRHARQLQRWRATRSALARKTVSACRSHAGQCGRPALQNGHQLDHRGDHQRRPHTTYSRANGRWHQINWTKLSVKLDGDVGIKSGQQGSDVAALPTLVLVLNIKFNPLISVVAILGARAAFITIVFFHSFLDVVCHLATGFKFPI